MSPATVTPEPVVKEKISADSKPDTQARSASGADGADAAPPVTGLLPYETNVAVRKWLAQAGQNLEAALEANGNSKDLGKRLRQLDAVKFAAAGGLVLTTLTNEDPHTVRADVRFPTQNAMGVEGTMTLILRLTLSDVGVSRAIAIRAVEFKPR